MHRPRMNSCIILLGICISIAGCKVPAMVQKTENRSVPKAYNESQDSTNMAAIQWRKFFTDQNLVNLIDTALTRNQELNITLQEIEIAKNDVRFRQGPLLPTVGLRLGGGVEKVGRYTSQGAGDASTEILPGKEVPDPLTDLTAAVYANWEAGCLEKVA